jgi:hypothetical protein
MGGCEGETVVMLLACGGGGGGDMVACSSAPLPTNYPLVLGRIFKPFRALGAKLGD